MTATGTLAKNRKGSGKLTIIATEKLLMLDVHLMRAEMPSATWQKRLLLFMRLMAKEMASLLMWVKLLVEKP